MTEAEWLGWEAPERMLSYLRRCISRRKLRLFITAVDLPTIKFLHPESEREALPNLQEVLAELGSWADSGIAIADVPRNNPAFRFLSNLEGRIASRRGIARFLWDSEWVYAYQRAKGRLSRIEKRRTARLLAEIVGNPFRPV